MEQNIVSVSTLDDQEFVARSLSKYDFLALPVVDTENRLVGIVTVDDAMDVLQDEVTEDIEKMAAIVPTDKPYLKTSAYEMFKARAPWLLLLMVSATFTGQIITKFEDALAAFTVLTAYIPMLMDTGGNAGSQSAVTVIRGISLGEIRVPGHLPGHLEGDPGLRAVRRDAGRGQLRQADAGGPDALPQSGGDAAGGVRWCASR
jgi:magnesium transporter